MKKLIKSAQSPLETLFNCFLILLLLGSLVYMDMAISEEVQKPLPNTSKELNLSKKNIVIYISPATTTTCWQVNGWKLVACKFDNIEIDIDIYPTDNTLENYESPENYNLNGKVEL